MNALEISAKDAADFCMIILHTNTPVHCNAGGAVGTDADSASAIVL